MVTDRVRIDSLALGQEHLSQTGPGAGSILVVTVVRVVPPWLAALVEGARAAAASVIVEAEAPTDLDDESRAGWEIGVCTAALAVGADDVIGVDAQRVARVREINDRLAAAQPRTAPEGGA
ncbi:MAG: hypothetical protein ACTHN0_02355 [Aquihabitans sp.]